MKTSEQVDEIFKAFFGVQQELKTLKRDKAVKIKGQNGSFEFRYTPLDSIMEYLTPIMGRHGLAVSQFVGVEVLTTRVMHTSGQWMQAETALNKQHASMKDYGAELTYKRRYALSALLGIVSDEDVDVPKISATKGVLGTLAEDRQNIILDSAEYIKDEFAQGNEWGAYETVSDFNGDELIALWGLLPSNLKTRMREMKNQEKTTIGQTKPV